MTWVLITVLFCIGLWGVIGERNMVRKVIGLNIANSSVTLLFVYYASLSGTTAPIISDEVYGTTAMVDPIPHALMLTAIVVGICVVALALVLVYKLYQRYQTLDMHEIERRVWGPKR